MTKYLDPKIDVLFKKIFGGRKELLISFLNSLLPLKEGQEIVAIEYLSPELLPITPLGKFSVVDVRCIDNGGRAFIVEMQSEWSNIFRKRLLVNGSKAVIKQIEKKSDEDVAKKFQELKPVYVLAVVNDKFSKTKNWYHHSQIMDPKNPDFVIDGLDYVLLELPNFTPDTWTHTHKELAILWLRFLKEMGEGYRKKLPAELVSNKLIKSAINMCEEAALTPAERYAYERAKEQVMWDDSIKGLEDEVVEARKALSEKDEIITEKDVALAEKDEVIAEKDVALAEKEKEIEKLKKLLEKK
jgi:predicted transposase/invertase (TIGR01784 family)